MLTDRETEFLEMQQKEMQKAELSKNVAEMNAFNQAIAIQEKEKGMIKEQLDLSEELDTIEHLLKGHVLENTPDGGRDWVAPENPDMIVLTDYGIYLILNTILFYLNKNTLLSNYDEETIFKKMEDFAEDLNDTLFVEYDRVFKQPTSKECKEVLMQRINKKTELKKFAYDLIGKKIDEKEIKKEYIKEIEHQIDKEITKIRETIVKNKLKRFLILMRQLQDIVHSTYLRALGGIERRTLRQHIHVSENVGNQPQIQKPSKLNPLNWGR